MNRFRDLTPLPLLPMKTQFDDPVIAFPNFEAYHQGVRLDIMYVNQDRRMKPKELCLGNIHTLLVMSGYFSRQIAYSSQTTMGNNTRKCDISCLLGLLRHR